MTEFAFRGRERDSSVSVIFLSWLCVLDLLFAAEKTAEEFENEIQGEENERHERNQNVDDNVEADCLISV